VLTFTLRPAHAIAATSTALCRPPATRRSVPSTTIIMFESLRTGAHRSSPNTHKLADTDRQANLFHGATQTATATRRKSDAAAILSKTNFPLPRPCYTRLSPFLPRPGARLLLLQTSPQPSPRAHSLPCSRPFFSPNRRTIFASRAGVRVFECQ